MMNEMEQGLSDLCDMVDTLRDENEQLRRALHDAIDHPKGVVPDSAAEFYEPHTYYKKESDQ